MSVFAQVKKIGRTFEHDGVLWLSYSGSGIEFEADGGFEVTLVSDDVLTAEDMQIHLARYLVFVDVEQVVDSRLSEKEKKLEVKCEGRHTFKLIKASESNDSTIGLRGLVGVASQNITPAPERTLKIEFIGDSITCGYGVEGSLSETYTTATENFTKSWAYLLSSKLNADYSAVSKSGAGLISGYTGDGIRNNDNILSRYYSYMGCSMFTVNGVEYPSDFKFDFDYNPDIVFINIGTNDSSYCRPDNVVIAAEEEAKRSKEFYSLYKAFLEKVRSKNPFAKIVCVLGIMGAKMCPEVRMAVEELVLAGDKRIWFKELKGIDSEKDGYGTDYHPSEASQQKLAEEVYEYLKGLTDFSEPYSL